MKQILLFGLTIAMGPHTLSASTGPSDMIKCQFTKDGKNIDFMIQKISEGEKTRYQIVEGEKHGECEYEHEQGVFTMYCKLSYPPKQKRITLQERQFDVGIWTKSMMAVNRTRDSKFQKLWDTDQKDILLGDEGQYCSGKLRGDSRFILSDFKHDCGLEKDPTLSEVSFGNSRYPLEDGDSLLSPKECLEKELKKQKAKLDIALKRERERGENSGTSNRPPMTDGLE